MRGHALSGSRKLNKHWQSGKKDAGLDFLKTETFYSYTAAASSVSFTPPTLLILSYGGSYYTPVPYGYIYGPATITDYRYTYMTGLKTVSNYPQSSAHINVDYWKHFFTSKYVKKTAESSIRPGDTIYFIYTILTIPDGWNNLYTDNTDKLFNTTGRYCYCVYTDSENDGTVSSEAVSLNAVTTIPDAVTFENKTSQLVPNSLSGIPLTIGTHYIYSMQIPEYTGNGNKKIYAVGLYFHSMSFFPSPVPSEKGTLSGTFKIQIETLTEGQYNVKYNS